MGKGRYFFLIIVGLLNSTNFKYDTLPPDFDKYKAMPTDYFGLF